jgi:hypothetical protein
MPASGNVVVAFITRGLLALRIVAALAVLPEVEEEEEEEEEEEA